MRMFASLAVLGLSLTLGGTAGAAMLTAEVCATLAKHEAANNVAYQPGQTVRGGRVVPANVRAKNDLSPTPTAVDVTVLLQDRFAIPANPRLFNGEVPVSRFFVRSDGVVNYAGQPLNSDDQQAISAVCRRAFGR
jgi:hypothetical protein